MDGLRTIFLLECSKMQKYRQQEKIFLVTPKQQTIRFGRYGKQGPVQQKKIEKNSPLGFVVNKGGWVVLWGHFLHQEKKYLSAYY